MSIQYVSNDKGKVTAVQLPIKEWKRIKKQYPDIENIDAFYIDKDPDTVRYLSTRTSP